MNFPEFSSILIKWYQTQKRDLPWRHTSNPYFVWLSEIILQQTRVVQGLPYYLKFVEKYPTIYDLANASQDEIFKLWQGLGYYSRAKNLHETAQKIAYEFGGNFPTSYAEIIKLKGIGDYTASAIASICYNEPVAVVDGNVYRVLSRIFDIELPINSTQGGAYFKQLATELLDTNRAGQHNQALMEFGAMQCKPQSPNCSLCVFSERCLAFSEKKVEVLPVKIKKGNIKKRYFHYIVPIDFQQNTLFELRKDKDIWQGLYEFPLIEVQNELTEMEILQRIREKFSKIISVEAFPQKVHKLSHQYIYAIFWVICVENQLVNGRSFKEVKRLPTSILTANFLKTFDELKKNSTFGQNILR